MVVSHSRKNIQSEPIFEDSLESPEKLKVAERSKKMKVNGGGSHKNIRSQSMINSSNQEGSKEKFDMKNIWEVNMDHLHPKWGSRLASNARYFYHLIIVYRYTFCSSRASSITQIIMKALQDSLINLHLQRINFIILSIICFSLTNLLFSWAGDGQAQVLQIYHPRVYFYEHVMIK